MKTSILRGGQVCDGSGREPEKLDILIAGNKIEQVGAPGCFDSAEGDFLDISGKTVVPGFIDAHAHDELRKLKFPDLRSKLLQGITTVVDGQCGLSPSCVPGRAGGAEWQGFSEYVRILKKNPVAVNTVALCGHNSIRHAVMGVRAEKAAPADISAMRKYLESALEEGAAGWSTGLTYFPGKFADAEELKALAAVTRGSKKVYSTHLRSEGDELLESVDEAIEIARAGSGKLQLSHLKTIFPRNFHKIDALLEKIDHAISGGLHVHADRYPYVYSSTRIGQTLPDPYDKISDISVRLQKSAAFQSEVAEALKQSPRDLNTTILLCCGKTLAQLAEEKNITVEQLCMQTIRDNAEQLAAYLCMSEQNLQRILAQPYVCAGSDGISSQLDDPSEPGHPRAIGTMPKFFQMVKKLASTGEAVRRMTALPAAIYNIPDRGLIRPGFVADLVVLDPENFDSAAGFSSDTAKPTGIFEVIVAGNIAWTSRQPEKINRYGSFIPTP